MEQVNCQRLAIPGSEWSVFKLIPIRAATQIAPLDNPVPVITTGTKTQEIKETKTFEGIQPLMPPNRQKNAQDLFAAKTKLPQKIQVSHKSGFRMTSSSLKEQIKALKAKD